MRRPLRAAWLGSSLVAFALLLGGGCGSEDWTEPLASVVESPSRARVSLPSPYLGGYHQDLKGEVLNYHSPVPTIGTSLLVRSEDRTRSIAWETEPIPADFSGREAVFSLMVGIDVHRQPRSFDLRLNGRTMFRFENPRAAEVGDRIRWVGLDGVEADLHVTLIDRHGDAMGFLFLTVPRALLVPGQPLELEVLGESSGARTWFMVFRDDLEPRIELQNAPAILRTPEGEAQVLRVDLLNLDPELPFILETPMGSFDTVAALGHTRLTLPVPAVPEPQVVEVGYRLGEDEGAFEYRVTPPRRMEIFLLHHTHLDIGYTHHQDEVERIQWESLEEALRLGEASAGNPPGARFVWNPEGIWPVESYVTAHPGEETEALMEGIRKGWIELDGMYAGLLTGLANEEALLHAFDAGLRLAERSGVPIRSEMLSDIPGFSWGLVEALSRNGIEYLSIGPNFGHRIGHFTSALGDRPFWWEGPSGGSRVLTWVSGGGYAWFHTGLGYENITTQLDDEKVFAYLDELFSGAYPYDMTYLRYNIGSDNGPPDPGLADAVKEWNARYASPVLTISGTTAAFQALEDRYGSSLPTYRGDLTGHWEDGAASSARETAMVRRVAESLPQTEALARMLGSRLDEGTLEDAWRNVLLFQEHTWGSWNSISEPYSELTTTSWDRKRAFAEEAEALGQRLRRDALRELPGENPSPIPDPNGPEKIVEVFNTLPWPRSGLVVLPQTTTRGLDRVLSEAGEPVASQRLQTGELAFLAENVQTTSLARFSLHPGDPMGTAGDGEAGGLSGETSQFSLRIDSTTGDIASLVHRESGRELVAPGDGGLNEYIYIPGRDPTSAIGTRGPPEISWLEKGPLVWAVRTSTPAPGLRGPLVREVNLVEGLDQVEVTNRLEKAWVLDPEAVLFRFPFDLESPQVRIDVPFGSFRPELDQVPGACKNYFTVQRWVDLSDQDWGVTFTSLDAPLIQLGEIRSDPIVTGWVEEAESSPTLFSYVMNNYWETNYRAAQDDDVTFRYMMRVHDGPFDEEEANRAGLDAARPLVARVLGGRSSS